MARIHQIIRKNSGSFRRAKKKFIVAKALKGRPQLRGVCIRIYTTKPKKPNSANRKVAKLRLSTGKKIIAYVHGSGHNLQQHSVVMVRGGRRRDLPGIHYQLVRGKYDFSAPESFFRAKRRSKFGGKRLTSGRFSLFFFLSQLGLGCNLIMLFKIFFFRNGENFYWNVDKKW